MSERTRLTLADIEQMQDEFLKPDVIAAVIGCSAQMIRNQAEEEVKSLGFPISKIGHGYWIPRQGFLNWARGMQTTRYILPAEKAAPFKVKPGDMIFMPASGEPIR